MNKLVSVGFQSVIAFVLCLTGAAIDALAVFPFVFSSFCVKNIPAF